MLEGLFTVILILIVKTGPMGSVRQNLPNSPNQGAIRIERNTHKAQALFPPRIHQSFLHLRREWRWQRFNQRVRKTERFGTLQRATGGKPDGFFLGGVRQKCHQKKLHVMDSCPVKQFFVFWVGWYSSWKLTYELYTWKLGTPLSKPLPWPR